MEQRYFQMSFAEKQRLAANLQEALSSQTEITFAFIYGSFTDYLNNLPFQDIDIGVYVIGMDEKKAVHYSLDLSQHLSNRVKVPVDVRVLNFAPVTFLFHVIKGQLLIEKDENIRCEFMERVIRHYLDIKPLIRQGFKEAFVS